MINSYGINNLKERVESSQKVVDNPAHGEEGHVHDENENVDTEVPIDEGTGAETPTDESPEAE